MNINGAFNDKKNGTFFILQKSNNEIMGNWQFCSDRSMAADCSEVNEALFNYVNELSVDKE